MSGDVGVPLRMQAVWIDRLGPVENIRCGELPLPLPGPTDVLVRVEAVAVNPVDTFVRSGAYRTAIPFPFVIGRDLVGTVAGAGSEVTGLAAGERVWCNSMGHSGRQGATAAYAAVAADRLYRLPAGADAHGAVAILHPAATAHLALHTHARIRAGETVYVAGGGGNVGSATIVLATRAGARVIASARAEDLDHCRSLGAAVALDYRGDLARGLRDAAPDGVDIWLDTSGRHDMDLAVDLLAARGRIILMAGMSARPQLPVGPLYTRDRSIIGFAISNASAAELADAARSINRLLAQRAFVPRKVEVLPFARAADAHRRLETGQARGTRLVLCP